MKFAERSLIVDELLKLAKKSQIDSNEKKELLEIVEALGKGTETQKTRFILYYGLGERGMDFVTYDKIAKLYGCTTSAVTCSIISLKNKLKRINKDDMKVIERIVNKHKELIK